MKKSTSLICIIIMLVVFIFIFRVYNFPSTSAQKAFENQEEKEENLNRNTVEPNEKFTTVQKKPNLVSEEPRTTTNENHNDFEWFSTVGLDYIDNWRRDNFGYFTENDLAEYQSYPKDALVKLAKSNDVKAIQVLAERMLLDLEPSQSIVEMYLQAAVNGSTFALVKAASIMEGGLEQENLLEKGSADLSIEQCIEVLAILHTALIRGDKEALYDLGYFKKKHDLVLTDDMKMKLEEKIKSRYKELERTRINQGLGEFDNNVPEIVEEYYKVKLQIGGET